MLSRKRCAIDSFSKIIRFTTLFTAPSMEGVYVRRIPEEERMEITVNYKPKGPEGVCKSFNMHRAQVEEVGKTITRLKATILKSITKKKKKKKTESEETPSEPDLNIRLSLKGSSIEDENLPVSQAFVQGAVLHIEDCNLPVEVNLPSVLTLVLPTNIMAGFPIYPKIQVEFCDLNACSFVWHKEKPAAESEKTNKNKQKSEVCKVAETFSYIPVLSDIGYKLKVTCFPKLGGRSGGELSVISKCDVEAGPGICPFENRQVYTQNMLDDEGVRVVSYNILADIYADSDFSRNELFPYCPPYALAIDYRKQLLLKELSGYNADLICLQEVDRKVYMNDLLPALDVLGFEGAFQVKDGSVPEGEAVFFRKSKFREVEDKSLVIRKVVNEDPLYTDIKEKISQNATLQQEMEERGTIVQVLVLESLVNPGCRLCVANTHLYFHPKACCVRSLQTVTIIRHLEQVVKQQQSLGYKTSMVFCGDFNCSPKGGAYSFITKKTIEPDNYSWSTNPDLTVEGMEFTHDLDFTSACGEVEYTNYAGRFHEQLDYIFIDKTFDVVQKIPNPDHADVELHIALPSVVFPSDHIAQICDLKWKSISD